MTQILNIYPQNPQLRLLKKVVDVLKSGGIIVYPTDSTYALGCTLGNKKAIERIMKIRQINYEQKLSIVCRGLSEVSKYAKLDNSHYRLLKSLTPGPYTFILKGTKELPKHTMHPKRKNIGLRIPDCKIVKNLLSELDAPIVSSTLLLPDHDLPMTDPKEIYSILKNKIDLIIDAGNGGVELTTIISFLDKIPEVIRYGKGNAI